METPVVVQLSVSELNRLLVESARQGAHLAAEERELRMEKLTRDVTLATKTVLTLDEASRLYGRKVGTLRGWIRMKKLRATPTGRGYVVERADVEACLCKDT